MANVEFGVTLVTVHRHLEFEILTAFNYFEYESSATNDKDSQSNRLEPPHATFSNI